MARLTADDRKKLPEKEFAGKDRSYPIPDKKHASLAIGYSKKYASPDEQAKIKRKACGKYPDLPSCGGTSMKKYENPLD